MATYPLDAHTLPTPQPPRLWRGVVRFFAWLTIFGAGALIALYYAASRHVTPPDSSELVGALRYQPFFLLRKFLTGLSGAQFKAVSLLLAPLAIAALSALLSLGGPSWRRIMLAQLSLLVAAYNLFACLSLIWAFSWNESGAGVIDIANYVALSASLMSVVVAFGFLVMALAGALRWLLLDAQRARVVARWWVAIITCGGALLIGSYFTAWGSWRSPGSSVSERGAIPVESLSASTASGQGQSVALLLALPVAAALCAYLTLRAPRWGRAPLALLALLAGGSSLVASLALVGSIFLRPSGASVLDTGSAVGLGTSALIVIATFGLFSTPYPARATPPDAFTPDAFTPDAFTPDAFTDVRPMSAPEDAVAVRSWEGSQGGVALADWGDAER